MGITVGKALKYSLLPGILPRARNFLSSGFYSIAPFMAWAYFTARLLPANHPYLNPANAGRFGIRHVLSEARRHLVWKRENIDQIIIYYALMIGMAVLFCQIVMLVLAVAVKGALAQVAPFGSGYYSSFFVTPVPGQDIAFLMLDRVFGFPAINGAPSIYGSDAIADVGGWPKPFHIALHTLFQFYNLGVLAIGLIVFLYLAASVVGETAVSGTPFGQRFNRAWAPVRMIFAVALLTPLSFGMNGAQLVTLYMAKFGSSLATNGWIGFNAFLVTRDPALTAAAWTGFRNAGGSAYTPIGVPDNLVVKPNPPQFNSFLEFMFLAHTCRWAHIYMNDTDINNNSNNLVALDTNEVPLIRAYQVHKDISQPMPFTFNDALTYAENFDPENGGQDITIRFGEKNPLFTKYSGNVHPTCGEITIKVKDLQTTGAMEVQRLYYEAVRFMFQDDWLMTQHTENIVKRLVPVSTRDINAALINGATVQTDYIQYYNDQFIIPAIDAGRTAQISDPGWAGQFLLRGWGGAAIWYNKVSQYNGSLVSSTYNLPTPTRYPDLMEWVKEQRAAHKNFVYGPERFKPVLSGGEHLSFPKPNEEHIATILYFAQTFWTDQFVKPQGIITADTITALFGTEGLFRLNDNLGVHPLAMLAGVGRSLVESAASNLGYSIGTGIFGGVMNIAGQTLIGSVGMSATSFMVQIAFIGLAIGIVLYYIVPFMPFIYFYFAVGGWVKAIFEAMVGLPLWALAHIRIDGNGIPGPAGMNGYYLILEIFLRPILTIFGLIAAIFIYMAQVDILHEIWHLVVSNLTGFDSDLTTSSGQTAAPAGATGSLDFLRDKGSAFFFTVVYAIVVYMMAVSSFKLIDQIPNNILRWMGTGVNSFGSMQQDPAGRLLLYVYGGASSALGKVKGGLLGFIGRNS